MPWVTETFGNSGQVSGKGIAVALAAWAIVGNLEVIKVFHNDFGKGTASAEPYSAKKRCGLFSS
jgi:hypothetical protein